MKRSRSRSGITLRDRDGQSSLTIHVCFLRETQFVGANNANMEEADILEKITLSSSCYLASNQVFLPMKVGADAVVKDQENGAVMETPDVLWAPLMVAV